MTDSNPKCAYHPNWDAITKCEKCGKLICAECKNIFQQRHSHTSSSLYGHGTSYRSRYGSRRYSRTSYYYTRHELCTPCFYERKIKVLESPMNYCGILFGVLFTAVAIFMTIGFMSFPGPFSPGFFTIVPIFFVIIGIGIVIAGIRGRITAPQKIEALKAKYEEFFNNLSSAPSSSQASAGYDPSLYKSCPYCGDKVEKDEKICDKCGSEI